MYSTLWSCEIIMTEGKERLYEFRYCFIHSAHVGFGYVEAKPLLDASFVPTR